MKRDDERVEWLAAAFDSLDQAGVPIWLREKVQELVYNWDPESVSEGVKNFTKGTVIASWSTPPQS